MVFARTLGDPRWEAYGLLNLALTNHARGAPGQAHARLQQSLSMFAQADDPKGASRAHGLLFFLAEDAASGERPPPHPLHSA